MVLLNFLQMKGKKKLEREKVKISDLTLLEIHQNLINQMSLLWWLNFIF